MYHNHFAPVPSLFASSSSYAMDSRIVEGKRAMKERVIMNKENGILEEEFEDDMEEEEGGGGFVEDEKKSGGKRGSSSGGGAGVSPPSCQVERCGVDLTEAKRYHRRHKVCEIHAKAPAVVVAGLRQRFCQQCSRFHELGEFDESKRSCRRRLAGHNERRRKSTAESHGAEGSSRKEIGSNQLKDNQCRQGDERGRHQMNFPGNPNFKRPQIR